MGEKWGNRGSVAEGVVGIASSASSAAEASSSEVVEDDGLGPFKVAEVGEPTVSAASARWRALFRGRELAVGLGVASGLFLSGWVIVGGQGSAASEIGSVLLPEAWSTPDGVDSADGGGGTDGGRSTFSRLLFGDDSAGGDEAAGPEVSEDEPRDADPSEDNADVDPVEVVSDEDGDPDAGSEEEESEDQDASDQTTSTSEASVTTAATTASTVASSVSTGPSSTTASTTRPTTTTSTTESSTTSTSTTTSTTTTTTTTTTEPVVVAAPTGCEVQTSTSGVGTTGVEIHEPSEEFAIRYVLYDGDRREVIRVSNPQQVEGPEIEFEAEAIGFDPDVIYYAAAVERGVVSDPTECERRV